MSQSSVACDIKYTEEFSVVVTDTAVPAEITAAVHFALLFFLLSL